MRRHEGPRRYTQNGPRLFVAALQSASAVKKSKNQLSRDFLRHSIFDFCNNIGTKRTSRAGLAMSVHESKADFPVTHSSEFDPDVWSGRVLQVDFAELAVSGLASMYPVSDWSCFAPDHHGYQRACDLVNGQASIGPFGSPVCARARKTEPPSRLILSQTSAGNC